MSNTYYGIMIIIKLKTMSTPQSKEQIADTKKKFEDLFFGRNNKPAPKKD
jgi:hypothetical protein